MIDSQDNGWGLGKVPIIREGSSIKMFSKDLSDRQNFRPNSNGLRSWRLCLACAHMICELARACANNAQMSGKAEFLGFPPHSLRGFAAGSCPRPIALPQQSRELRRLEFQRPVTVEFVFRLWSLPLQTKRLPSSQSTDKKTGDTWTETASQV